MKKINLIKTLTGVGILGITSSIIPLTTTSCSDKGITATFNSLQELRDWFTPGTTTSHVKVFNDDITFDASYDKEQYLDFFVRGKRLWGWNVFAGELYEQLLNRRNTSVSPIKINFNFNDNSGSYKILNAFSINDTYNVEKNATASYKVFDNGDIEKTFDWTWNGERWFSQIKSHTNLMKINTEISEFLSINFMSVSPDVKTVSLRVLPNLYPNVKQE